jgi:hypothetical protein
VTTASRLAGGRAVRDRVAIVHVPCAAAVHHTTEELAVPAKVEKYVEEHQDRLVLEA